MSGVSNTYLLIHSPLVGPYTWHQVRNELQGRGHKVIVPSLLEVLSHTSDFKAAIRTTIRDQMLNQIISGSLYVVLHSAAGAFVPTIREAISTKVAGYIFVDARLPKHGASLSDEDSREAVNHRLAMTKDGMLPRWSEWFSPTVIQESLPDQAIRENLLEELQPIPASLFEERLEVFAGWPDARCGYIRLSEFYKPLAERAREDGWLVIESEGGHLYMLIRPKEGAELILDMSDRLKQMDKPTDGEASVV